MPRTAGSRHYWHSCACVSADTAATGRLRQSARRRVGPGRPSPGHHARGARQDCSAPRGPPDRQGWRRQCVPCRPMAWPPGGCRPKALRAEPDRLHRGESRAGRQSCRSSAIARQAQGRPPGSRRSRVPGDGGRMLLARRCGSGLPAHCSTTPPRRGPDATLRQYAGPVRQRRCRLG
ncbi:hypothetical protein D3C77_492930 [compost metagenome]